MAVFDVVWKILLMALITYLCRVLTLVLVRKKIKSRFFRSFLEYLPTACLRQWYFPPYSTRRQAYIPHLSV